MLSVMIQDHDDNGGRQNSPAETANKMAQRFCSVVNPVEMSRVRWCNSGDALQQRIDQSQDQHAEQENGQHMHDREEHVSGGSQEGTHELAHKPG